MNTIDDALNKYLEKGFGSMNKNDFEVWIFNHLMHSMLKGKDNYAISTYLKIPESKVKRLRYEASLKYSSFSEEELFSTVNKLLSKSKFKKGGLYIQFVVEDVAIRKYLDSLLKRDGRFSDSSFNSEIVTIDIDDLEYILLSMPEGKKNIDEILSKAKKKLKTTLSLQKIATKSHKNIKNKDKAMITEDSSLPLSFEGRIGLSKR